MVNKSKTTAVEPSAEKMASIADNADAMIILTQGYPAEDVARVVDAHTHRAIAASRRTTSGDVPPEVVADRQYLDGFDAGFMAGETGDHEKRAAVHASRRAGIREALAAPVSAGQADGWDAATRAIAERAAGHQRDGDYELHDECIQCVAMLNDIKPASAGQAGKVAMPRDLAQRCLTSMKQAVTFGETRQGRPPSQTCMFEIEELEALLAAPVSPPDGAMPEPVTYLRWRASQVNEGHGNIGHREWYEVCEKGEISDDRTPAFPVYATPVAAQPAEGSARVAREAWKVLGENDDIDATRLLDVVLIGGVALKNVPYSLIDWTRVADWRYSIAAPERSDTPAPDAPINILDLPCTACGRKAREHSPSDFEACIERLFGPPPTAASKAPDAAAPNKLLGQIETILHGIDDDQISNQDGWWENSDGAHFGAERLAEIRALFSGDKQGAAAEGSASSNQETREENEKQ